MNLEDTLRNAIRQLEFDKARLSDELADAKMRELNAKEAEKSALRKLDEVKRDQAPLKVRVDELEKELRKVLEKEETKTFEPHDLKPNKKENKDVR